MHPKGETKRLAVGPSLLLVRNGVETGRLLNAAGSLAITHANTLLLLGLGLAQMDTSPPCLGAGLRCGLSRDQQQ